MLQAELRARMERDPIDFFVRAIEPLARRGPRAARRLPSGRSGRPRAGRQRHHRGEHRPALPRLRAGRRAAHHQPRLQRLRQRAPGRGRARRGQGGGGRGALPPPRSHRGDGRRARRRHRTDPAGPPRPRDQRDRRGVPGRVAGPGAAGAGRGRAGRRRARPGHAAGRRRGARRSVLHRELPQVALRAEGRSVPPRAPGPAGRDPSAGRQPWRQRATHRPFPVPARVRLDGDARSHASAVRRPGHRARRQPRAGRMGRGARPEPRAGMPGTGAALRRGRPDAALPGVDARFARRGGASRGAGAATPRPESGSIHFKNGCSRSTASRSRCTAGRSPRAGGSASRRTCTTPRRSTRFWPARSGRRWGRERRAHPERPR